MDWDPEVEATFQEWKRQIENEFPQMREVLRATSTGTMSPQEAISKLIQLADQDPQMHTRLIEISHQALAPLRDSDEVIPTGQSLAAPVDEDVPVVVQVGPGLPSLNPLYEGALTERLQFDGDIPEARTLPLPEGQLPAVPVETNSRNMVAIGHMLDTASKEVMKELSAGRASAADRVNAEVETAEQPQLLGAGFHKTGDEVPVRTTTLELWESKGDIVGPIQRQAELDVSRDADKRFLQLVKGEEPVGYRTGQFPARRDVETPSGGVLATMTPETQREAAWRALSTTQGRRTALGGVAEVIAIGLANHGVELIVKPVDTGHLDPEDEVVVYETWTVQMSGPNATASQFSFIDTAGKALLSKLVEHDLSQLDPAARLEVLPINTVNVREVGWAARVVVRS